MEPIRLKRHTKTHNGIKLAVYASQQNDGNRVNTHLITIYFDAGG